MIKTKYTVRLFLIFVLFLVNNLSYSQRNIEFIKENFKNNKEGLKKAVENLDEGNDLFEQNTNGTFLQALDFYLKANRFNPDNAQLNYKIGICYLNSIAKEKSKEYFLKAFNLKKDVSPDIHFYLGRAYHLNYGFDEAIKEYFIFKKSIPPAEMEEKEPVTSKLIEECNTGIRLVKAPERVFIDNLGPNINTKFPEYGPVISTDESILLFTSKREGTTGNTLNDNNQFTEDIYISYNQNGKWQKDENIGPPLNTNGNDAVIALSPDGQQMFTFGSSGNGDIYVSELKGSSWSRPEKMGNNINSKFHESAASFSYDGNTVYFCSAKEIDNYGLHDIFMCKKETSGKWGKPINLGTVINTEYDEFGVFMHPDGRTLYFCSTGHKTMGGFDTFKSVLQDDGTWSQPENLGYPVNSPDDDIFFVINASGKHGYYSSAREGGFGNLDIYMITFLGLEKPLFLGNEDNLLAFDVNAVKETVIEKPVELKTTRLTILKGFVKDAFNLSPLESEIEIVDNEKNEVISVATSNSVTGKYLVSLPSGKNYGIAIKAKDYLFHSENFDIPAAKNYQEINKDFLLDKISVGAKVILKNIFFDFAKSTLRPTSFPELERVVNLMNDYPSLRVEISGHTDNIGSLATNKKLSESRAKAVVDYIVKKGIEVSRIEFQGYAYFQPVSTNDTEEGRQDNRRVEFKILSK